MTLELETSSIYHLPRPYTLESRSCIPPLEIASYRHGMLATCFPLPWLRPLTKPPPSRAPKQGSSLSLRRQKTIFASSAWAPRDPAVLRLSFVCTHPTDIPSWAWHNNLREFDPACMTATKSTSADTEILYPFRHNRQEDQGNQAR